MLFGCSIGTILSSNIILPLRVLKTGAGNAHVNPLRDKQHGRIYRIVSDDAVPTDHPDLGPDKMENCLAALKNENLFWRLQAQRLLVENKYVTAKNALVKKLEDQSLDAIGLAPGPIHAIWTLDGLGLINLDDKEVMDALYSALSHPSPDVRKNALRVLPNDEASFSKMVSGDLVHDDNAQVALAAILYLIDKPSSADIGSILFNLSQEERVESDEWLARAVYVGAVKHKEVFTKALHQANPDKILTGYQEKKVAADWSGDAMNVSDWKELETPSRWSKTSAEELQDFDGIVWVRKTFILEPGTGKNGGSLNLGPIDDTDDTYVNGKKVGGMVRALE